MRRAMWKRVGPLAGLSLAAILSAAALASADRNARSRRAPAAPTEVEGDVTGGARAEEDGHADRNAIVVTGEPTQWLTSRRYSQCRRYGARRYCDSPRKVAKPEGPAAVVAKRLGIGAVRTASHLLGEPPEPRWVAAVEGRAEETLRWPVDGGKLWRGFGMVRGGKRGRRLHKGLDIGAPDGTHVLAVNDGLVAYASNEVRGYGNYVMIIHADATVSAYAHLQAAYVFPGQQVRRGQVIGEVGHTGLARGSHLHFEWRRDGHPRNPWSRMDAVPEDSQARGDVRTRHSHRSRRSRRR